MANSSPRTHKTTMADLNQYTAKTLCLLIILIDDAIMLHAFGHLFDVIGIKYMLLQFIYTSLVISHLFVCQLKRKRCNKG